MEGSGRSKKIVATFRCIHSNYQWRGPSSVYPAIEELKMHQEEFSKQKEVCAAAKVLLSELTRHLQTQVMNAMILYS